MISLLAVDILHCELFQRKAPTIYIQFNFYTIGHLRLRNVGNVITSNVKIL